MAYGNQNNQGNDPFAGFWNPQNFGQGGFDPSDQNQTLDAWWSASQRDLGENEKKRQEDIDRFTGLRDSTSGRWDNYSDRVGNVWDESWGKVQGSLEDQWGRTEDYVGKLGDLAETNRARKLGGIERARQRDLGRQEQFDKFLGGIDEAYDRQEELVGDYRQQLTQYGQEHMARTEEYTSGLGEALGEAGNRFREMSQKAQSEMDKVRSEYQDESLGAIAAAAAGVKNNLENQKARMRDQAGAQNLPPGVMNQQFARMDAEAGRQLLGNASQARMQFNQVKAQLGTMTAQLMQEQAGGELQLGAAGSQIEMFGAAQKIDASKVMTGLAEQGARATMELGAQGTQLSLAKAQFGQQEIDRQTRLDMGLTSQELGAEDAYTQMKAQAEQAYIRMGEFATSTITAWESQSAGAKSNAIHQEILAKNHADREWAQTMQKIPVVGYAGQLVKLLQMQELYPDWGTDNEGGDQGAPPEEFDAMLGPEQSGPPGEPGAPESPPWSEGIVPATPENWDAWQDMRTPGLGGGSMDTFGPGVGGMAMRTNTGRIEWGIQDPRGILGQGMRARRFGYA